MRGGHRGAVHVGVAAVVVHGQKTGLRRTARRGEAPGGRDAAAVAVARHAARVVDRHHREPARLDAAHAVRQAGLHPGLRARLVARRKHHHAAPCDVRARSVDPARQGGLQVLGGERGDGACRRPGVVDDHGAGVGGATHHVGELRIARRDGPGRITDLEIDERRVVGEPVHARAVLGRGDDARHVRAMPVIVRAGAGPVGDVVVARGDIDGDRAAGRALARIDASVGDGDLDAHARAGGRIRRVARVPGVVSVVVHARRLDPGETLLRVVFGGLKVGGAGIAKCARRRPGRTAGAARRAGGAAAPATAMAAGEGSDGGEACRGERRPGDIAAGLRGSLVLGFLLLRDRPARISSGDGHHQHRSDLLAHVGSLRCRKSSSHGAPLEDRLPP